MLLDSQSVKSNVSSISYNRSTIIKYWYIPVAKQRWRQNQFLHTISIYKKSIWFDLLLFYRFTPKTYLRWCFILPSSMHVLLVLRSKQKKKHDRNLFDLTAPLRWTGSQTISNKYVFCSRSNNQLMNLPTNINMWKFSEPSPFPAKIQFIEKAALKPLIWIYIATIWFYPWQQNVSFSIFALKIKQFMPFKKNRKSNWTVSQRLMELTVIGYSFISII